MFTLFDVGMIQIWTFLADPSTERVPSLAERVAYLRHPINLRLFNWRVPALVAMQLILILISSKMKIKNMFASCELVVHLVTPDYRWQPAGNWPPPIPPITRQCFIEALQNIARILALKFNICYQTQLSQMGIESG